MDGASQDGRSEPWPHVHSLQCDRSSRAAGEAVLTWDIRPSGSKKLRRPCSIPARDSRPFLNAGFRGLLVHSSRPESTGSSTSLLRQSAACAHITRAHHPVARRRDHRLPSSKRAVSILILWCTLNACMSMVGLHWDNFWDNGGQHGQESEEGKEDSQEDSQEEKEVVVRRNL